MDWSWGQSEVGMKVGEVMTLGRGEGSFSWSLQGMGREGRYPAWALTQHVEPVEGAHGFTKRSAVGSAGHPVTVVSG